MKIEVCLSVIQVPLEGFSKVIPKDSHLQKLKNFPSLEDVDKRVITPVIDSNEIEGYIIHDFCNRIYKGMEYFTIEQLEKMSE